ncbi:MAG: anaerobic ribonucleoside-triphosphate reductase [Promethearchaeota archaeon]
MVNLRRKMDLLERHLKVLGQRIRIEILKILNQKSQPMNYSSLQKGIWKSFPNCLDFSFHLKSLKSVELIDNSQDGYYITSLGKNMLKNILSMEKLLLSKDNMPIIRTSQYTIEPFDLKKIEKYLIIEGKLNEYWANKIVLELKERLSRLNIDYLTTSLIREFINTILIENDLEKVRNRLCSIGLSSSELKSSFEDSRIKPNQFIHLIGSKISEKYLLLNLFPKNLADLYYSGEIALLNIDQWALKPSCLYLDTSFLMNLLCKKNSYSKEKMNYSSKNFCKLIFAFSNHVKKIMEYFSGDILLGNLFNELFINFDFLNKKNESIELIYLMMRDILDYKFSKNIVSMNLTLDLIPKKEISQDLKTEQYFKQVLKFINSLSSIEQSYKSNSSLFYLLDDSLFNVKSINIHELHERLINKDELNSIMYLINKDYYLNSYLVNVRHFNDNHASNSIVLDKILINLYEVAKKANQDDGKFFEILHDRIEDVFQFYQYKVNFLRKRFKNNLKSGSSSQYLNELLNQDDMNNSIKVVSYFGLPDAIKQHCMIEIENNKSSMLFAIKILNLIKKIIDEKNKNENENYLLTQPHSGNYLIDFWNKSFSSKIKGSFDWKILKNKFKFSFNEALKVYNSISEVLQGGSVFNLNIKSLNDNFDDYLKKMRDSGIRAYTFS